MTAGVPNFVSRKEVKSGECEPSGDWTDHAACRRDLNRLWITAPNPATWPHQVEMADEVCGRCPVRVTCDFWARSGDEFEGIAGGLLWPTGGACFGGHGRGGRKDKWCAGCRALN